MKKSTFYFPHDYTSKTDDKILRLRFQLGMEGYGIFWYIIESLAEAGGILPLDILPMMAEQMKSTEAKVNAVVKSYGLFEIVEQSFFSDRLNMHLELRRELSKKGIEGAKKRWNKQLDSPPITPPNAHPYAKERKGKEKKRKEIKTKEITAIPKSKLFGEMRQCFESAYLTKTGTSYYWGAKDSVAINQLKNKILFKIKEKEKNFGEKEKENYDDEILRGFQYLISVKKDQWIENNFSLPIINSKFNEIISNKLKNQNGNREDLNSIDVNEIIRKKFGSNVSSSQ